MLDPLSIQQIHCSGNRALPPLMLFLFLPSQGFIRSSFCSNHVLGMWSWHLCIIFQKGSFLHFNLCTFGFIELLFSPTQSLDHPNGREQFDKILMGLLRRILDTNKRVQEAACSAFATLEEVICIYQNAFLFSGSCIKINIVLASNFAAPHVYILVFCFQEAAEELVPHLEVILQHLMCAYGKYQVIQNLNNLIL